MDFFSIGPLEILLILVVALLVLGPKELPVIGRRIGKAIGEIRRNTDELRDSVMGQIEQEESKTPEKHGKEPLPEPVDSVSRSSSQKEEVAQDPPDIIAPR